jgi:hypothetical protein
LRAAAAPAAQALLLAAASPLRAPSLPPHGTAGVAAMDLSSDDRDESAGSSRANDAVAAAAGPRSVKRLKVSATQHVNGFSAAASPKQKKADSLSLLRRAQTQHAQASSEGRLTRSGSAAASRKRKAAS